MSTYTYVDPQQQHQDQHHQVVDPDTGEQVEEYADYSPYTYDSQHGYAGPEYVIEADGKNVTPIQGNGVVDEQGTSSAFEPYPSQKNQEKLSAILESYFVEPTTGQASFNSFNGQSSSVQHNYVSTPVVAEVSREERERIKKLKQAEAARLRYHRLSPEQKRELNLRRTEAQKRKRQRERELEELENILRASNDIQDDPEITEQLREKRMRAKWAEAARARYARMTPEERKMHNNRRRMRQMQNALAAAKMNNELTGDPKLDEEAIRRHIKLANAKKAEAARERYHRMSDEEKRLYNQRRTEAFRRRRLEPEPLFVVEGSGMPPLIEEEMLLSMPIGRINHEALDRAHNIVLRNARRAESARLRYNRMTAEQRREYNLKRASPRKRDRSAALDAEHSADEPTPGPSVSADDDDDDDHEILSNLQRDLERRTQKAQATLLKHAQTANGLGETAAYVTVPTILPQQLMHDGQIVRVAREVPVSTLQIPSTSSAIIESHELPRDFVDKPDDIREENENVDPIHPLWETQADEQYTIQQ